MSNQKVSRQQKRNGEAKVIRESKKWQRSHGRGASKWQNQVIQEVLKPQVDGIRKVTRWQEGAEKLHKRFRRDIGKVQEVTGQEVTKEQERNCRDAVNYGEETIGEGVKWQVDIYVKKVRNIDYSQH